MSHIQSLAALSGQVLQSWLRDADRYRHHGIGVLQGYVLESSPPEAEYRLHLWHPKLRLPDMENSGLIHDHRFNLESTILYGAIIHTVYQLDESPNGPYQAWNVENARSAEGRKGGLQLADERRYTAKAESFRLRAGQTYKFPSRCFHRTDVTELAITLCRKLDQQVVPARILARVGAEPKHAFDFDPAEHVVQQRAIIADAIQALRGLARAA